MMRKTLILVGCAIFLLAAAQPAAAECAGKITITLENYGSFASSVTVIDQNSNQQVFSGSLAAWEKKSLTICTSSAGYGNIKYKKSGQGSWTSSNLLRSGDTVRI